MRESVRERACSSFRVHPLAFHDLLAALECVPAERGGGLAGSGKRRSPRCLAETL